MSKKKFFICFLVLIMVAVSAVSLVACADPTSKLDPGQNPAGEEPAPGDLLWKVLMSMGSEDGFVSMDFNSTIKTKVGDGYDERKAYLKGNFKADPNASAKDVQLGFGVVSSDGKERVEFFLDKGKFYINAGGKSLYLEDVDFRWLIEQIQKISSIDDLLGKVLSLIPNLDLPSLKIKDLISMVSLLIFQVEEYTFDKNTGIETINLRFVPDQLIETVKGLLSETDLDGALATAGIDLGFSLNDYIASFTFPKVKVNITASLKNGRLFDGGIVELNVNDYIDDIFNMQTNSVFKNEAIDFIPENISTYVPFGLLKLRFDTTFALEANNVDVGKIVNFFAGKQMLPEGKDGLILNADLGLTVKLKVDIRLKEVENEEGELTDESKLLLEIYGKHNPSAPMLGVYLQNSEIYVNIDNLINMAEGNIKLAPKNIKFSSLNLSKYLSNLIEQAKNVVSELMDKVFVQNPDSQEAQKTVLTVASTEEGKSYISPTLGTIIDLIRNATGFGDFITTDNDSIDLTFNNELLAKIKEKYGVNIPDYEDFGKAVLSVQLGEYGLDNISLTLDMKNQFGLSGLIKIENFMYGFKDENIDKLIPEAIKGKEYVSNARDLIFSAMDDIDMQLGLNLKVPKGTYNLAFIFESLGIKLPDMPLQVSQDMLLDLTLDLQLQLDQIDKVDEKGKLVKDVAGNTVKENIISRAKISITNKVANIIFPQVGEAVSVYYFDDRYPGNSGIGLTKKDGVNKKTNGTVFVNLDGFEFSNIKLPNLSFDVDLTTLIINEINKINFDFTIPELPEIEIPSIPYPPKAEETATVAAISEELTLEEKVMHAMYAGNINSKMFTLTCTSKVIQSVLDMLNVKLTLPELSLKFDVDYIDGISLELSGRDGFGGENKFIAVGLKITKAKFGIQNTVNTSSFNIANYGEGVIDSLEEVIYRAMDDINAEFNFTLNVQKGSYNISTLLKMFGLEVTDIPVKFSEDFVLNLQLVLQLQMDEVTKLDINGNPVVSGGIVEKEKVISRAYIGLINKTTNLAFKEGEILSAYYFDDRLEANLDPKFALEKYKYNAETQEVEKSHGTLFLKLDKLNIANITISNTKLDIDLTSIISDAISKLNLSGNTASEGSTENGVQAIAESADQNYLKIELTAKIINEILKAFNVNFELPDLKAGIEMNQEYGIIISVSATEDFDGTQKEVVGKLSIPKFEVGRDNPVDISKFNVNDYNTEIRDIIKNLLKHGKIEAKVDLTANQSTIDLRTIINSILALSNQKFALPLNIDLNDFANTFDMLIQWEMNYEKPENSRVIVELKNDNSLVLGLYVKDRNIYMDLTGLGLPRFALTNTKAVDKLVGLIDNALNSIINSIIPPENSQKALQQRVASANNMTVSEMNNQMFAEAAQGTTVNDYINLLLQGLMMDDGKVVLELTNEICAELFNKLAVNIVDDVNARVEVDIFGGSIRLKVQYAEVDLDARLNIVAIGKSAGAFELPSDLNEFASLDGASGALLAESLLNQLKPGLWIDLVSKNAAITGNNLKFTKLKMQKCEQNTELSGTNGDTAPAGSILLSLVRMDGYGDPSGNAVALYIILNPNAASGQLRIRATKNLLPDIIGIDLAHFVNISINLDLKTILADLFGPLLETINKEEVATVAENPFGNLTVESIINSINVKIYNTKNIKLNVSINHNTINDLIPKLINMLNGMTIDIGSGPITINGLEYSNTNPDTTFWSLWEKVITPIVSSATGGAVGGTLLNGPIAQNVRDSVADLVSRLLPMPQFVEMNLNAYIIDGALDNIDLIGYGAKTDNPKDRHRFELRLFNDMSDKVFFGTMKHDDLNNTEYQAPYINFDASIDTGLENMFTTTAYVKNENKMYYEAEVDEHVLAYKATPLAVTWSVTAKDGVAYPEAKPFSKSDMSAFKENGKYVPGVYTAMGRCSSGSIKVTVVISDNYNNIKSNDFKVEDVVVHAGGKLPSAITLTNGTEKVRIDTAFTFINASPNKLGEHSINAKVEINLRNGSNTEKVLKDVVVTYKDSQLVLADNEPYHVNIHNYKEFYNNVYNKGEILVKTKEGRSVYVPAKITIKNGSKALYESNGNISNETDWINGFTTTIQITISGASAGQSVLEKDVIVDNRAISFTRFNSKDTIIINTEHTQANIPTTAEIFFEDGTSGVYSVNWKNLDTVKFGIAGVYENVSFELKSDYAGNSAQFNAIKTYSNVKVIINKVEIAYAKVGANNNARECDIAYDIYNKLGNQLGSNSLKDFGFDLRFVTTDGTIVDYQDTYMRKTDEQEVGPDGQPLTDSEGNPIYKYVEELTYKITRDISVGPQGGVVKVKVQLYVAGIEGKTMIEVPLYFNVLPATNTVA